MSEPTGDGGSSGGRTASGIADEAANAGSAAAKSAAGPDRTAPGGARPGIVAGMPGDEGPTPGLAEEVESALARVLGRAGRPARIG